jgi:putative FmdB family regulatory protein
MALYEFQCESCHERFEKIQRFSDPTPETCPKCGAGPVRKLPSSPAFQFKGTGFYATDYAKKSMTDEGKSNSEKSSSAKGSSEKSDAGKSDSGKSDSTKIDSGSSGESAPAGSSSTDSSSATTAKKE